ncbi:transcriptional regulator, TetR family [Kribbella flavida DSM 17836]|uniref:Transcriptional regulator, TetR family n=1 Tax=Kribbella flavida (strain DSM 17836 / JCM 10339 / NBRC 14399) TaxID=479435 RepID=D2PZN2_KRIFD|nr:TetR/AcrR family transcriptional regulator [Kribbella flavida]ADB35598.1 transcriptional regulator, TetR family [Kribbella flavida DSM 17836]
MGNRESLLAGARKCLQTKGFAQTTVRDITEAAGGVSMAAIGYHFGSKEALLTEALVQLTEEWGRQVEDALSASDEQLEPAARFAVAWDRLLQSALANRRLWAVTFEVIASADQVPAVRERILAGLGQARDGLLQNLGHPLDADNAESTWAVGSLYQALLTGLMAQSLIDPDHVVTGSQLAHAFAEIGRHSAGRPR